MKKYLFFVVLFFYFSTNIFAQKQSIWLGVQAGLAFQYYSLVNNSKSLRIGSSPSGDLGINLEYRFSKFIGVEIGFRYTELAQDLLFVSEKKGVIYYGVRENETISLPLNLVGRLNLSRNRAFVVGKLGLAFFQRDENPSSSSIGTFVNNNGFDVVTGILETSSINEKGFLLGASIGLEGRFLRKGNIRLLLSHSFSPVNVMQWNCQYIINNEPTRYETIYSKLRNTGVSVHVSFPLLSFGKEKKLF